jgi:hypothetical protein
LTALAVLILAVAVVAVRAGSPGTVEAATGTIDVLNVGTCYATDGEVFGASDCVDGDDDEGDNKGYEVTGRDDVSEVATVFATYSHDPKTAPDSPRAVLENSNLIKISIADTGRDKRTPVLLPAGDAPFEVDANCTTAECFSNADDPETEDVDESGYLQRIQKTYKGIEGVTVPTMSWQLRGVDNRNDSFEITGPGVETGISIIRSDDAIEYMPMDVADDSLISFWGRITRTGGDPGALMNLKGQLKLDEDVGPGGTSDPAEENSAVAPWLSIQKSIEAGTTIELMYIVYHTSEYETLVGGLDEDAYDGTVELASPPDFSNAEEKTDAKLVVEARADGREGRQMLRLHETGRFDGRYEGYLKLTDENGGGMDDDGWGLTVGSASGHDAAGAATIGVESGPVVIAYKDTDGSQKLLEIEIDTVPPAITIDTPAHKSQGQDTSPEFSGSYLDRDSGLREDSFALYVDHQEDDDESGDSNTDLLALDLRVSPGDMGYGVVEVAPDQDVVESLSDYVGYTADVPTYAVINHTDVFGLDDEETRRSVEGDNFDDGDSQGTFGQSVRIDFDLPRDVTYNHTIDFQAVVADVAGNLGFSDSDNDGPRFINDLGEEKPKTGRYNVIGWYARHIFFLDETDPEIYEEQSVTGFYGENDDDEPQVNRSGVLVAFDKAVDADSIGVDTFSVTLDTAGTQEVAVVDVDVDGRAVYLLLESELASDARPFVDIASGQWVSDPAGNRRTGGDQDAFEAKDGITPVLTVTLSGGSGSGEGDEGPSKLTNDSIIATISADEEISSTPSLAVVCSNIGWDPEDGENTKDLDSLIGGRSGGLPNGSANFDDPDEYDCEYTPVRPVHLQQLQSYSRPGLTWEYEWVNFTSKRKLEDGKLSVVAYARDRQSYASLGAKRVDGDPAQPDTYNWGATTVEFRYDTTLNDPGATPESGATVTESRPFVLLTYDDATTVSISEFSIDGTGQEIDGIGDNRFLYWPESLDLGSHTVTVDAVDAAGNEEPFEYSFKVAERAPFNLKLIAGWNAVSFPANPEDNTIGSVFTEGVIDMVAGWDAGDSEKPWSIATRMEGEWSTHDDFATLSKVHAQYGYWVHAQGFVTQRVKLIGGINRTDPEITPPDLVSIPTLQGWNFVGVIDQDGDQTEGNYGETLMNGDTPVDAGNYLGKNKRAYRWDPIRSKFDIVEDGDPLEIGEGIWVYYGGGIAP